MYEEGLCLGYSSGQPELIWAQRGYLFGEDDENKPDDMLFDGSV